MNNNPHKIMRSRAFATALSALGIILAGSPLQAANEAWSTNPTDGNFSGTNWTSGQTTAQASPSNAAATGDALFFDTSAITTLTNDLSGATFAGITFNSGASAYTIGGNAFTLSGALTNNSSSLQTFSNAITLQSPQTITGAGNFSLSGNLTGAGNLTKSGTGTLSLSGTTNAISGAMILSAGRLNITAGTTNFAGAFSNLANTAGTTAIASVSSGATLGWTGANGGNFASASGASAVLYNSGVFNITGTTSNSAGTYLGNAAASFGYLRTDSGATTTVNGRLWVAQAGNAAGATGVLDVAGGTVTVNGTNQSAPIQINGDGNSHATSTSYAGVNVVDGTLTIAKNAAQTNLNTGQNEYTSFNITGAGKFTAGNTGTDSGIGLSVTNVATNTATLTVANGGTLETSYIYNNNTLGTGVITFDNGTIRSLFNNPTGIIQGTNTRTYIHSGGVTFDTNGFATTVANALLAPAGNGIDSITLGGTATGYVGAPVVVITGGGGTGAAAVANFDPTTGTVTGITITSKGSGYTSAPTITLVGGNGGSTGAGAGTATATSTIAAVTGGGLTKTGTGVLTLSAANTYTGATSISSGTLKLASTGSINNSSGITIAGGATFDVSALSYTLGSSAAQSLRGAGNVTGAISLASGSTVAAGVNASTIGTLAFSSTLTGTSGATFSLKLDSTAGTFDLLTASGAVTLGSATLALTDIGGGPWTGTTGAFSIIHGGSISGTFLGLADGSTVAVGTNTFTLNYTGTDVTLTAVSAVPEPSAYAALLGALMLGWVSIRRRRTAA